MERYIITKTLHSNLGGESRDYELCLFQCASDDMSPLRWQPQRKGAAEFSNFNTAQAVAMFVGGVVIVKATRKWQVVYEMESNRCKYLDVSGGWSTDPDLSRVFHYKEDAVKARDSMRDTVRSRERRYITVEELAG